MKNIYKLWVALSLIIVFAAGFVGGILLDEYILEKPRRTDNKKSPVHFPTLETMAEEFRLTIEQRAAIRGFFEKNEEEFKTMRSDMRSQLSSMRTRLIEDIKSALDEEQKAKFQAMLDDYKSQRQREMEDRMKHNGRSRKDRGERQ